MNYQPNSRFANYVTNIAFHLSLSRSMCSYLLAIVEDAKLGKHKKIFDERLTDGFRDFITTGRSLEGRGLIKRIQDKVGDGNTICGRWVPTEEGRLVAELVRRSMPSFHQVAKPRKKSNTK